MSLIFENGRKYLDNFESFQNLLYSLSANEKFLKLLKYNLTKNINLIKEDILFDLGDVNIIKCLKYILNNRYKNDFDYKDLDKSGYKVRLERNNINIFFKSINNIIYFHISGGYDIIKHLSHHLKSEDFSYWDHVDKPINICEYEWEKRRNVWENFDNYFCYNIFNINNNYSLIQDILEEEKC